MGVSGHEGQPNAHKVDDSGPEADGDDNDSDQYRDNDFSSPEVIQKLLLSQKSPEAPPMNPPADADEADQQLTRFRPIREWPEALCALLDTRADPNYIEEGDISVLRKVNIWANTTKLALLARVNV